ncbi:MAG: DUF3987 domain-containing protein [Chlamydiales bacterium]
MSVSAKNEGAAPWPASAPFTKNESLYTPSIPLSPKIGNLEAAQFLNLIAEGEQITFQTFDDVKGRHARHLVHVLHGTLDQHLPLLTELNGRGAGVFFTVNETDLKGRETKNITKVRAVFVDLDGAPLEPILLAPLPPHVVVESSPKRFHAYWLMEGLPLEQFSLVQKDLIERFDADRAVHDLPRVMRLPGFFHRKGDPTLVRVIERNEALPYRAASFLQAFQIDLTGPVPSKGPKLGESQDPILQELNQRGMVRRQLPNKIGAWDILCPFADLHTTGDQGTAYFEAHTNGYKGSGFKCQHSHCEGKGIEDLRIFLGLKEEWGTPLPLKEELYPVVSFREEMLPETLRPWIMDNAERMQVPPDFLAATCIVVVGSLVGRKTGIFPKAHDDWLVIPNLWGAVVGRPSLLKSPAVAEMMKPLDELAAKAIHKHREDLQLHEQKEMWAEVQKLAQKEEMKKAARNKSATPKMPQFDQVEAISKPIQKRYKTEDGTVEKIGEILLENPQGILIHRDELVGWLKGLDKYGREGDRAFFLESWNGNGPYTVDRIGRGTLHIPALCLSIVGGIQPGPLGSYVHQATTGGGGDDGLLQRFQMLVWPDAPKVWKNIDRTPNLAAREQAFEVFRQLDAFAPFEPSLSGAFETYKLRFAPQAQHLFDEWRTHLEQRLRNGELGPALESHLAKYRSLMPSLALIFYLIETVGRGIQPVEVDLQAARQAILWCEYLETHAKRLYASGEDPSMESARALLERIKRGDLSDGFSPRDVYHAKHWSKLDTAEQVANAIKLLEEFGWVRTETTKTIGRPSTKVSIHPQLRGNQ